jgi:type IV pilus assembly protein PilF
MSPLLKSCANGRVRRASMPTARLVLATLLLPLAACTTQYIGDSKPPPEPADPARRAQARTELASGYFERGQNDVALEEINTALQIQGGFAPAWNLRGLILASRGDAGEAERSFERAVQLAPDDGNILHNQGWFLCQLGRYEQAHARFDAAVRLPTYQDVPRTLLAQGVCFARNQQLDRAEPVLTRAYELDTTNPVVGYNLADVLYRRGEYERARFFIRRINGSEQLSNAQTLWLAARVENRLGNRAGTVSFGNQLRQRFPQSPEAFAYERGRFDD